MTRVIGAYRLKRGQRLFHRVKGKQPFAGRQDVAEAGVLRYDRTSGGKIAGAALAEPAAAEADILVLGHGKLAARGAYVIAIGPGIGAELVRVGDAPAMALQHPFHVFIRSHRQLDRLRDTPRQIDEFEKLVM